MINKIKLVIFGSIVGFSLLPIIASAGVTLTTAQHASANWFWVNATGCSVSSTATLANLSPLPSCSLGNTDAKAMSQCTLSNWTPGTYWFTINGTSNTGGALSASDWLTITAAAPTTVPSLTINPGSGYSGDTFTLNWTTSNNTPTKYCMTIVGPGININDNPTCALTQGLATSFTNNLATFGLNTPGLFYFKIYACNDGGCTGNSNQVSYNSAGPKPAPVVNVNISFLDKVKTSLQNILTEIKNGNLVDEAFAYTTK